MLAPRWSFTRTKHQPVVEPMVSRPVFKGRMDHVALSGRFESLLAVALFWMASAVALHAQEAVVQQADLGRPDASLAELFAHVSGVCELMDGRVVVVDSIARTMSIADFQQGTVTQVGREGDGPGEYRLPVRLVPWVDGGCALVDKSRLRQVPVLNEQGEPGASVSLQGTPQNPGPSFPHAADTLGNVYSVVRGSADSAIVARWRVMPWHRDTIARLSIVPVSALPVARQSHDPPPFTTYDNWAVSLDGRVAIVSADPYRVALIAPDGSRTIGPAVSYPRERVTAAHREEWRHQRERPTTRYVLESAGLVAATARVPYVAPARWPEHLPAFLSNATRFAPDGSVWVHRAGLAAAIQRLDVFDRAGRLQRQLQLPPYARVAGFGARSVYVAIRDSDDQERLVRFGLR